MDILTEDYGHSHKTLILDDKDFTNQRLFSLGRYTFEKIFIPLSVKTNKHYEQIMTLLSPHCNAENIYYYE
jgi:hypothetical protein